MKNPFHTGTVGHQNIFEKKPGTSIAANNVITSGKVQTGSQCAIMCVAEEICGAFSLDDDMNCVIGSVECEAHLDIGTGEVFIPKLWVSVSKIYVDKLTKGVFEQKGTEVLIVHTQDHSNTCENLLHGSNKTIKQ